LKTRILLTIVMVVCIVLSAVQIAPLTIASAETGFDKSNVMDDLLSSTVGGSPFDILDYPFDESKSVRIINVVEYCYSFRENMRSEYALYLYVYNPQGLNIDTNAGSNKVQMATEYSSNNPTKYDKFRLECVSVADEADYKGLFFKFKVVGSEKLLAHLNSNERRYDISGVELLTSGNQNATEYKVGGTYYFTGYAEGLGPSASDKSTLTCRVQELETLELQVKHTYYRTNVSDKGKDHYNEVNTAYFSVPKRVFDTYGYLQKIRAEWWEYKTKPAIVTSNSDFYNTLKQYSKTEVKSYNSSIPVHLYSGYTGRSAQAIGQATVHNYDWVFNMDLSTKKTFIGTISELSYTKAMSEMIPIVFYSKANSVSSVFSFLFTKPVAGNVESTEVAQYIYNYTNSLGHGYIDCNGRNILKDLFESSVDEGRTMGYNDKSIDLADTFNLKSYDSNHNWINKLLDFGFDWPKTSGDYSNVAPIYELKSSDLTGSDDSISQKLLVNKDDVSALKSYFNQEDKKGNKVIMFRFATTDYYCAECHRYGVSTVDSYVAQQTVFLDFDIIELTFNKEGEYHVIPAVSSPTDIINELTAPPVQMKWWEIVLAILLLVLLLIILWPVLPFILKALWWLITLPLRIVAKVFSWIANIGKRRKKKDKEE